MFSWIASPPGARSEAYSPGVKTLRGRLLGYRFEVRTVTTIGTAGSYVTRVRGRTMEEAWERLLRELDARADPHEVVKLRTTVALDWRPS
jgi:hypothetical protein